ncbi:MAG: ATPase, partial [Chitinivibrionia bacterium]|nr:ATPase [Chitinivibrionia bacterium]
NIASSVIGALKKKPDSFGSGLVFSAIPSTQALYGFVGYVIFAGQLEQAGFSVLNGSITLGAGIAMGLVCLISAISQGGVCISGMNAIGNGHNVFGNTLILIAFPEFFAIMSLVTAILLSQLIK